MQSARRSGILLHPTSLPGPFGSGDFGRDAYYFIDWLAAARQSLWQMLPLCDIGVANSPYMSPSAFAGNIYLISPELLKNAGWLKEEDLVPDAGFDPRRVNYPASCSFRMSRLRRASDNFFDNASKQQMAEFQAFCRESESWLSTYAVFRTLCGIFGAGWQNWPVPLSRRDPYALRAFASENFEEIRFWKFCQWCFYAQWDALRDYAHKKGVDIIGDIPIFISLDSADVWEHPELFSLDEDGHPVSVAGAPPDKFSSEGQHWGNPLYEWRIHAANDFDWWTRRMKHMMRMYDFVRLDHFRGFCAFWSIPAGRSAAEGKWAPGPGHALFAALQRELKDLRFIAEDLGDITPDVHALRREFGLPGMRVLQFAFDGSRDNIYLPYNHSKDTVVYTGTHDNDTIRGWWLQIPEHERDYARRYLSVNGDWIHWDLIRAAWASAAMIAITPYQDVLGLGSEARMNTPGRSSGSWEWRFGWDQVSAWPAEYLGEMTDIYGRVYRRQEP